MLSFELHNSGQHRKKLRRSQSQAKLPILPRSLEDSVKTSSQAHDFELWCESSSDKLLQQLPQSVKKLKHEPAMSGDREGRLRAQAGRSGPEISMGITQLVAAANSEPVTQVLFDCVPSSSRTG